MKTEGFVVLLLNTIAYALRRGPHHPHGQSPVDQKHHHYKPRGADTLTGDGQLLHDVQHIKEDSDMLTMEMINMLSDEEVEFHYFSLHDFDKNSKLDGLELLKSVYHTSDHEGLEPDVDYSIEPGSNEFETYIGMVDRTLQSDDIDGDGYLSYAEYRAAREKNPINSRAHKNSVADSPT